jgi:Peptidase propeptide and YPEB domain.
MKRLFAIAVLLAGAVAPVAVPAAASAQDMGRPVFGAGRGDQEQAREGVRSGRQVPLSRVLGMIASRNGGRHLNTMQGDSGGRPAYFVQWQLPNGRVVVFVVDAESGQIIGRQGG